MAMSGLDEKEIKGLTIRLARSVIVQTVIIVAAACGFYFKIQSDIRDMVTTREEQNKYWNLKFEQIQIQNATMQKQLDYIQFQLDEFRGKNNNLK